MKEVNAIDKLTVDINSIENVQMIQIRDDNTAAANINADNVIFGNIKYSIMLNVK